VPDAVGQFRSGLAAFARACRALKGVHVEELEYVGGWETLARWCDELSERFAPVAGKYGEHPAKEPEQLREALFPTARPGAFGLLRDLQSLEVLGSQVQGSATVLFQTAQGLRDRDLLDALLRAQEQIRRALAWVQTHVKHKAAHTLLVPT
jgi:hypothetical protein